MSDLLDLRPEPRGSARRRGPRPLGVLLVLLVVLALLGGAVERTAAAGSLLTRQALELVNALVVNFPVLVSATALSLLVAVARGVVGRRG